MPQRAHFTRHLIRRHHQISLLCILDSTYPCAALHAIPLRICGIAILIRVETEHRPLGFAAVLAVKETQTKTDRALTNCFDAHRHFKCFAVCLLVTVSGEAAFTSLIFKLELQLEALQKIQRGEKKEAQYSKKEEWLKNYDNHAQSEHLHQH